MSLSSACWEMNAGIDFLDFMPSEIAAAVSISVTRELRPQAIEIDKVISRLMIEEKVKVVVPTQQTA